MIIPQKMKAKLASKEDYNQRFSLYRFELIQPYKIENLAGQYVLIQIDEKTTRAYSMCDRPDVNTSFELLVDHQPNGLGVNYLKNLSYGQEIDLIAPLGKLVIEDLSDIKHLFLVASGSGISPFRSQVTDLLQLRQTTIPLTLVWGMRSDADFFWLDDFLQMQRYFDNFTFIPTVSQPTPTWNLLTGRVTSWLESQTFPAKSQFLLCGNPSMINDSQAIIQQKGITLDHIVSEKFDS